MHRQCVTLALKDEFLKNRYKGSETGLIWEYSGDTENDTRKLESECEEECHRFDTAMRELGIEVDG
jgi:hypothetical protein